ncbi:hypothetical protein ACHAWO_004671 [Cyclotella atomus]|uniref:Uncharacterized protein n=1 Tax=Cyclotella atomus TaxID=382360 RepID=A0ABD3QJ87_9STRA
MNKMQNWFGGPPVDVLTDPETQSDGSPGDNTMAALPPLSKSRPPSSPAGLARLPSDDTLNRSSHGTKSNVEELRSSNAALIHQLSTQEASFMNQLTQCTTEFAEKETVLKRELGEVRSALQVQQNRVNSLETRIRERDAQLKSCKEEKGKMGCQITDLKNQLYQLQFEIEETSADKADCIQSYESKLTDATRSVDEMKRALDEATGKQVSSESKAHELQRENERLVKELAEVKASLQKEAQDLSNNHDMERQLSDMSEKLSASNLEVTIAKQVSQKEIANLRSMLRARDEAIQSLQQRLERSTEEMTTLETEVDTLREQQKLKEEQGQGEVGNLWKLNDEMAKIIEKQSKKVEDLNEKLEKKDEKLKEALQQKDEAIGNMREKLESKELEVKDQNERLLLLQKKMEEASENARLNEKLLFENSQLKKKLDTAQDSSSSAAAETEALHHERISSLECERAKANEKIDELKESLAEALNEVKSKENRIASLETELEDASKQVEKVQAAAEYSSGNFTRLRAEIENVTRERVRLESDHAREIDQMKSDLADVNGQLSAETEKVHSLTLEIEKLQTTKVDLLRELDEANNELNLVDDTIEEEIKEYKQQLERLENENAQLQSEIDDLKEQLSNHGSVELREAQLALIALDEEKSEALRDSEDRIGKLSLALSDCEEQIVSGEAKLNRAIRERELIISDLKKEVAAKEEYASQLKADLEELQLSMDKVKSSPSKRSFGMAIDPDCEVDSDVEVSKLNMRVSTMQREMSMMESEFKAKIEDRDKTISSLVMTSSKQESTIASLKKEATRLQVQLDTRSSSESVLSSQRTTRDAQKKEVESLKSKLRDMSQELSRANKKVASLSQELERANDQLSTTQTTQDVADLAGRLAVSDQAQRLIKKDYEEKLRERDAAISNLLQTIQSNEKAIKVLKSELQSCKKTVTETLDENQRLQHESEIFAAQIIDQDAEFADLNAKLKEKNAEIVSMNKDFASSKLDARKIASLQRRLDDMKDEKENLLERVDDLTRQLKRAESSKASVDEFEVERLTDELKLAKKEKEATEEKLTRQIESLRKLRNHAVDDFEAKLRARDDQIASLEKELVDLKDRAMNSNAFDIDLNGNPAPTQEQLDELASKCIELGDERDALKRNIVELTDEIETLRASSESKLVSELRAKLAQSEAMRESVEKNRSMFISNRDAEIDRLHKQLSEAKENQSTRELEQSARLKSLEKDNHEMREDFNIRIKEKNARIIALEQTLAAQEQVVGNMSSEMDQLQNGMEKISVQRRAEIEEMQQELMDYTSKATRLEREVSSLSMTLNEKKHKHKAEVEKLKQKIAALESESPFTRDIRHREKDDDEKIQLEEKIEHMKWLNSTLKDENDKLQEKLEKATSSTKKDEALASAKNNDKWRNVQLQEQVAVLSQRVIELEEAAAASAEARRAPGSPRKSILESPVMRSSLGNTTAPATPRSALRVSSYEVNNEANEDLLSNSARLNSAPITPMLDGAPPPLPRGSPTRASMPNIPKSKSSKISSIGSIMKRGSSYKMSPRSSPRNDDASNSTTNYNF